MLLPSKTEPESTINTTSLPGELIEKILRSPEISRKATVPAAVTVKVSVGCAPVSIRKGIKALPMPPPCASSTIELPAIKLELVAIIDFFAVILMLSRDCSVDPP